MTYLEMKLNNRRQNFETVKTKTNKQRLPLDRFWDESRPQGSALNASVAWGEPVQQQPFVKRCEQFLCLEHCSSGTGGKKWNVHIVKKN